MRRNRNTSRGGGGNRSGDPYFSDHLKDIDLELDLLKRKREMLEQQQQLIQPLMQQRSFNQQPFYLLEPKQSGSSRDFSHLYNDGSQQFRKPYGKRRQSDNDWQHDSYPKRSAGQGQRGSSFAGPSSDRNQRSYGGQNQHNRSTSFKYGQGKQFAGQKIGNQKQQRPAKNVANKVTKHSKASAPPNRLASQQVAERNKLVAAAIMSVAEVETRDREALRLLPDKVPTKQMTGRLELSLGAILRDIRDKCAETSHQELLNTVALQRVIKQTIRERIRTAMLGKVVGASQEIIKEYRAMYPKETDIEIVNIALEAGGVKPEKDLKPIVLEKDKPQQYFKMNMMKLIDTHLQEMFAKVEAIYKAENAEESPKEVAKEDNNLETNNEEVAEKTEETVEATEDENVTAVNDEIATTVNNEASNVENSETEKGESDKITGENITEATNGEKVESTDAAENTTNNVATNTEDTAQNVSNAIEADVYNVEQLFPHADEYKRMLPRLLKRHIPTILKLLHLNKMYKRAIGDIANKTREIFTDYGKVEDYSTGENTQSETPIKKNPAAYVVLPYYVKIMGKPSLPKKPIMNTFLEVFNPKSIKKHKSIHNLLFIGFTEKSDFDAIMGADGTVIGRNTLSIRTCEKNTGRTDENKTSSGNTDQNASLTDTTQSTQNESTPEGNALGNEVVKELKDSDENKMETDHKPNDGAEETAEEDNAVADGTEVAQNIEELTKDTEKNDKTGGDETDENVGEGAQPTATKETQDAGTEEAQDAGTEEAQDAGTEEAQPTATEETQPTTTEETQSTATEEVQSTTEITNQVPDQKYKLGLGTPTRTSSRISNAATTPSSIRTRRASKLMPN